MAEQSVLLFSLVTENRALLGAWSIVNGAAIGSQCLVDIPLDIALAA